MEITYMATLESVLSKILTPEAIIYNASYTYDKNDYWFYANYAIYGHPRIVCCETRNAIKLRKIKSKYRQSEPIVQYHETSNEVIERIRHVDSYDNK